MSDLKKQATSMNKAAARLRSVGDHTEKPLAAFTAQRDELSALGALGSLLGARSEIEKGMSTLSRLTKQLTEEWDTEATFIGEVSDAFDLLDLLLAAQAKTEKG